MLKFLILMMLFAAPAYAQLDVQVGPGRDRDYRDYDRGREYRGDRDRNRDRVVVPDRKYDRRDRRDNDDRR